MEDSNISRFDKYTVRGKVEAYPIKYVKREDIMDSELNEITEVELLKNIIEDQRETIKALQAAVIALARTIGGE